MNPVLQSCPDCGRQISASANACPNCGRKVKSTPINVLAKIILMAIGISISLPITLAIVSLISGVLSSIPTPKFDGPKNKDGVYCDAHGHWHGLEK